MSRSVVVYDDFSGGEWGSLGEFNPRKNMFSGTNMLVNRLGELMCRPGLINRTPSGTVAGVVHGFGVQGVPNKDTWYIQGTATRAFSILGGNNLSTLTGALAGTPSEPVGVCTDTNQSIIASASDKLYRINTVGNTVTALTGSPGLKNVALYGDRVIGGNVSGSNAQRLRWSDAANPNSWPAANFVDVGDNWGIYGVHPQRQHLLILKQAGYHLMTGVPGVNSVLRAQINNPGPYGDTFHASGMDDLVAVLPGDNTFPALHDGTRFKQMDYLDNWLTATKALTFPATHGIAVCNGVNRGFYYIQNSGARCIAFHKGIWSYHNFGVTVSGYVSKQGHGQYVYICDGGAVGTAPKFYIWNPHADTPGIVGGDNMMPGDDSTSLLTGNFDLPEWWANDGDEVIVRSVIVDYRFWNTGAANTNHFDLSVEAKNLYNVVSTVASNTVSVDSAQASSSASGTENRAIFGFGEQGRGNGFQLHFTNCRGLAVKRITVVLDRAPVRV